MNANISLSVAACLVCIAGCGGSGDHPAAPSASTYTLNIHVYNSATGAVPEADFTIRATSSPASIRLSDIRGVAGVDSQRAALRLTHVSGMIGQLAARTTSGVLSVPVFSDATYDLFLMSTASGANYSCLDVSSQVSGASTASPTLGRSTSGSLWNCPIVDGPDEPFQFAADEFNQAMNPFGLRFGNITYVSTSSSAADMTAAWTPWSACSSLGGGGRLLVQFLDTHSSFRRRSLVIHELSHAYLGAPDYYGVPGCFGQVVHCGLIDCSQEESASLTSTGRDAIRYWALMDKRVRP